MSQIIEKSEMFEVDGRELFVTFNVEATSKFGREYFEVWGSKTSKLEREVDFELNELLTVIDTEDDSEVTITKDLEKKLRPMLHNWISDNTDTLATEVCD